MILEDPFQDLVRRVRVGDGEAAAELVRQYEPEIRRTVRIHLTNPRLRRILDSMDICQSVLANFFIRIKAGQFELKTPDQLLQLLVTMAHHHLLNQFQKYQAKCRDLRRVHEEASELLEVVPDPQPSASQVVDGKELWEKVRLRLSEEECYLAEQRGAGRGWAEIAAEVGTNADALRKKLARALDRVAGQLGLDEVPHE